MGERELYRSLKDLEKGRTYEVVTTWCCIPVRIKLRLSWVSVSDKLVGFDLSGSKLRRVFAEESVYITLPSGYYMECSVFSVNEDELVLLANGIGPPPPCVIREFVRVAPSKDKPVLLSFCAGDRCIFSVKVVDISEGGVSTLLRGEEINKFSTIMPNLENYSGHVSLRIELPGEGTVEAVGELRNMLLNKDEEWLRLGFKLSLKPQDLAKVRRYIINRQREILDELKSL